MRTNHWVPKELAKALLDMTSMLEIITAIIRFDINGLADDNKQSRRGMQDLKTSTDVTNWTFEQLRTDVNDVHRELAGANHQQATIIGVVRKLQGEVKKCDRE